VSALEGMLKQDAEKEDLVNMIMLQAGIIEEITAA